MLAPLVFLILGKLLLGSAAIVGLCDRPKIAWLLVLLSVVATLIFG